MPDSTNSTWKPQTYFPIIRKKLKERKKYHIHGGTINYIARQWWLVLFKNATLLVREYKKPELEHQSVFASLLRQVVVVFLFFLF